MMVKRTWVAASVAVVASLIGVATAPVLNADGTTDAAPQDVAASAPDDVREQSARTDLEGCESSEFPTSDDDSYSVELPFSVEYHGTTYSSVYINTNGNMTFDAPSPTYTDANLIDVGEKMIAPFLGDVDTTGAGKISYGSVTYDDQPAFCVYWNAVGYYPAQTERLNTFRLILVSRTDIDNPDGFDIIFKYDQIQWDRYHANEEEGVSARVGHTGGTPQTTVRLYGSGIGDSYLDTGPYPLATTSLGSEAPGEHILPVRKGCTKNDPRNVPEGFSCIESNWWDWPDTDGDGLPDKWERDGMFVGNRYLDLPAQGARVDRKDAFVYIDLVEGEYWNTDIEKLVVEAFDDSPLDVALHIVRATGELTRSQVPAAVNSSAKFFQSVTSASPAGGKAFTATPWAQSASTPQIAKYVCVCPNFEDQDDPGDGANIGGAAVGILGDHVVITMDEPGWKFSVGQQSGLDVTRIDEKVLFDRLNAVTFMHELGHLYNLRHHGTTNTPNNDTNYKSIMSYAYNAWGVPRETVRCSNVRCRIVKSFHIDFSVLSQVNFDWRVTTTAGTADAGAITFIHGQSGERSDFYGNVASFTAPAESLELEAGIDELLEDPQVVGSAAEFINFLKGAMVTVDPARLLDTRSGEETIDGQFEAAGRLRAGQTTRVKIAGRGGVESDATGVELNIAAIQPAGNGFATLYPCTATPPKASSLNYTKDVTIANATTVALDSNGDVCIFSSATADYTLDVVAFVPPGSNLGTVDPARLLDTRSGEETIDGQFEAAGRLRAGQTTRVKIAGRGGVESDATGVELNIAAIQPAGNGFATLYPCTATPPKASSLNYTKDVTIANATTVALDSNGDVCIFSSATADYTLDVVAFISP